MPIAVRCLRGRDVLPERAWRLPPIAGWIADTVSPFVYSNFPLIRLTERHTDRSLLYHSHDDSLFVSTHVASRRK